VVSTLEEAGRLTTVANCSAKAHHSIQHLDDTIIVNSLGDIPYKARIS